MFNLTTKTAVSLIRQVVDDLFTQHCTGPVGSAQTNPVTGGHFVFGVDSIAKQKKDAYCAALARENFAINGPRNAPALPLTSADIDHLRWHVTGSLSRLVGFYARSLWHNEYDRRHPDFEQYARCLVASKEAPESLRNDPELLRRYPPQPTCTLACGLIWDCSK